MPITRQEGRARVRSDGLPRLPSERSPHIPGSVKHDTATEADETVVVQNANAWLLDDGFKIGRLDFYSVTATGTITDSD